MPASSADALLSKTDAELRFFVDNPHFYQPELVAAARRELQRRGAANPAPAVAAAAPAPPPTPFVAATPLPLAPPPALDYPAEYFDEPARQRPWLVPLLVILAVAGSALGIAWWRTTTTAGTQAAQAAREAAKLSPYSLRLEEAVATPLPTADADGYITRQLAVVPAAERRQTTAQQMQQYRGVSRRFWQAELPTEFVINQAAANRAASYAVLLDQIRLLEQQWHTSGNALVYTYRFPPTMADQLSRMRAAASLERKILENIKAQAARNAPLHLSEKDQMDFASARELLHGVTHELGTLQAR